MDINSEIVVSCAGSVCETGGVLFSLSLANLFRTLCHLSVSPRRCHLSIITMLKHNLCHVIHVKPRSNKRCFPTGVCQSGIPRGQTASMRAEGAKRLENTSAFSKLLCLSQELPLSQAKGQESEEHPLENTI